MEVFVRTTVRAVLGGDARAAMRAVLETSRKSLRAAEASSAAAGGAERCAPNESELREANAVLSTLRAAVDDIAARWQLFSYLI